MTSTLRSTGRLVLVLTFAVVLSLSASLAAAAQEGAAEPEQAPVSAMSADEAIAAALGPDGVLRFDVAEDMTRFGFDADNVHEDGTPANGNAFITRGYIYPAGTLTESNGVLEDGSPEFPELVLGEWVCRGWFVGEGAHATAGPMVVTTQLYNFGGTLGEALLVSDGYELADVGVVIDRAITGGTGPFLGADGAASQTFLGFNASAGVNLTFEIQIVGGVLSAES
jgi:hypothetical protein